MDKHLVDKPTRTYPDTAYGNPKAFYGDPLGVHAVIQQGQQAPNNIYLVVQVTIGGRLLRALLDTGAQPCVIKKSLVPIGTPIEKQDLILNGINGPSIKTVGIAEIPLEIGQICYSHQMVIVNDQDLRFPEDTDVIIGADMLISNQLDISTSRWDWSSRKRC